MFLLFPIFEEGLTPKCTVVAVFATLCLLIPQFYVLLQDKTTRWCPEPLMPLLITSIIFTFFVIGFTFLFVTMVPVPREVKLTFHGFGLVTFITGMIQCVSTSKAQDCDFSTPELYDISLALAVLCGVSIVYVAVLLPFWIINQVKQNAVLDKGERRGVCYEPVKCCSCLWHI
ncbi:uncharacterized protein LOC101852277 isoform X2 [Aplysia californica]|uniref:Uncharacterized protein LOC101852277 isoform X2 n=1 Tax=Aplysia californica TaxID=6500 RepID=A0ABM0K590_APLCA|nr:uncharacterized protein LOC101852277 isoform X2 [Aplysia californica]